MFTDRKEFEKNKYCMQIIIFLSHFFLDVCFAKLVFKFKFNFNSRNKPSKNSINQLLLDLNNPESH